MAQRPHLSQKIKTQIMYDSGFSCAVCQTRGSHIHHIDRNNANNETDNLILLCQTHHDEAHTTRELSLNLNTVRLKEFREKWYSELESHRVQIASAGNRPYAINATWGYINHARLIQSIPKGQISSVNPELFSRLKSTSVIDNSGIFIKSENFSPSESYLRNTVYDQYEYADRMALHVFYSHLVDHFVKNNKIIYLDKTNWNKTFIKEMVSPGTLIFFNKAQYFKKIHEDILNAEVEIKTFKGNLAIKYKADTRNMFGTTSITSSFAGHRSCASLLLVKSIENLGPKCIVHCSPIALGIGFQ